MPIAPIDFRGYRHQGDASSICQTCKLLLPHGGASATRHTHTHHTRTHKHVCAEGFLKRNTTASHSLLVGGVPVYTKPPIQTTGKLNPQVNKEQFPGIGKSIKYAPLPVKIVDEGLLGLEWVSSIPSLVKVGGFQGHLGSTSGACVSSTLMPPTTCIACRPPRSKQNRAWMCKQMNPLPN